MSARRIRLSPWSGRSVCFLWLVSCRVDVPYPNPCAGPRSTHWLHGRVGRVLRRKLEHDREHAAHVCMFVALVIFTNHIPLRGTSVTLTPSSHAAPRHAAAGRTRTEPVHPTGAVPGSPRPAPGPAGVAVRRPCRRRRPRSLVWSRRVPDGPRVYAARHAAPRDAGRATRPDSPGPTERVATPSPNSSDVASRRGRPRRSGSTTHEGRGRRHRTAVSPAPAGLGRAGPP